MARRKISQREAHGLQRQLRAAQQRLSGLTSRYSSAKPGVIIGWLNDQPEGVRLMVDTATALGHGVAVRMESKSLMFYAVKP